MKNTYEKAKRWANFIAQRPEFIAGDKLLLQFEAGTVSHLCECGCNSFNLTANPNIKTDPIAPKSERGATVLILEFFTENPEGTVEFIVYADADGNLDGIDVHFKGNSEPMPENFDLVEPPYQVYGALSRGS
jgi:hypothetical protein